MVFYSIVRQLFARLTMEIVTVLLADIVCVIVYPERPRPLDLESQCGFRQDRST